VCCVCCVCCLCCVRHVGYVCCMGNVCSVLCVQCVPCAVSCMLCLVCFVLCAGVVLRLLTVAPTTWQGGLCLAVAPMSPQVNARTPYTVHRTPYTVRRTPYTVPRTPYTIHHTPYTIHIHSTEILHDIYTFQEHILIWIKVVGQINTHTHNIPALKRRHTYTHTKF
jgi:hypothetical protein